MIRQLWTDIMGAVGLAIVAAVGFMLFDARENERPPHKEIASRVKPGGEDGGAILPPRQTYLGILFAREEVNLAPKAQGIVEQIQTEIGQPVSKGDVVAVLESENIRQQIIVSEAALRAALAEQQKSEAELNEASVRRSRREADKSIFNPEEIDDARLTEKIMIAQLEVAKAHVAQERARITLLNKQLEDTIVKAPFSGTVAIRYCNAGSIVGPGIPVAKLLRDESLWVRFSVPEHDCLNVGHNHPIRVWVDGIDPPLHGTIEHVSPEVDCASKMVVMEAKLRPLGLHQDRVRSGTMVEVALK